MAIIAISMWLYKLPASWVDREGCAPGPAAACGHGAIGVQTALIKRSCSAVEDGCRSNGSFTKGKIFRYVVRRSAESA